MKAFISYEEEGNNIKGIFELVEQTNNYIKIKSNKNTMIIPIHKVNKIKFKE
jgi:hypothetical protein